MFENAGDEHKMVIDIGDERKVKRERKKKYTKEMVMGFFSTKIKEMKRIDWFRFRFEDKETNFKVIEDFIEIIDPTVEMEVSCVQPWSKVFQAKAISIRRSKKEKKFFQDVKYINLEEEKEKVREIIKNILNRRQNFYFIKWKNIFIYKITDHSDVIIENTDKVSYLEKIKDKHFLKQIQKLNESQKIWICDWDKDIISLLISFIDFDHSNEKQIDWVKITNEYEMALFLLLSVWIKNYKSIHHKLYIEFNNLNKKPKYK